MRNMIILSHKATLPIYDDKNAHNCEGCRYINDVYKHSADNTDNDQPRGKKSSIL